MKTSKNWLGKFLILSMPLKENYSYLHFTKKEKAGTITLLFFMACMIATPFIYFMLKPAKAIDETVFANDIALLKAQETDSNYQKKYNNSYPQNNDDYRMPYRATNTVAKVERFNFDPNTLSEEGWVKLGAKPKTAASIQKYISKGGRFKTAEDLKKVWGLSPSLVNELMPYVNIKALPAKQYASNNYSNNITYEKREYAKKEIAPVDINTSGAEAWIALPGIGEKLAQRILTFKEKLGGFHHVTQIQETYGLPDSTYQKILPYLNLQSQEVKKININTATLDELKLHPYIRYALANAIVEYRTQHGAYPSVASLKKIMIITDEVLMKMAPYLVVN